MNTYKTYKTYKTNIQNIQNKHTKHTYKSYKQIFKITPIWKDRTNIFCTQSCSGLEANIFRSLWFTRYSFQEFVDLKLKLTKHTNLTYVQNIQNVCQNTKHRKIDVWKSVRLFTRMYFVILPVTRQYTKNRQRSY